MSAQKSTTAALSTSTVIGRKTKARTPWRREVERVVDELVVEEASVPRVDRSVRAQTEVALRYCPIFSALGKLELRGGGELRERLLEELPLRHIQVVQDVRRVGVRRVHDLGRGEVPVLRVRQVQVVPAQVLPAGAIKIERRQ